MDPLKAVAEVSDLIFQHLIGRELILATEVSPYWDEVIGCSFSAMKKIRILTSSPQTMGLKFSDVKKLLAQSPRKYQNFNWSYRFSDQSSSFKNVLPIFSAVGRSWKNIHLSCLNVPATNIIKLLSVVEPTIENVQIEWTSGYQGKPQKTSHLTFPKLKVLSLQETESVSETFAGCKQLKEFSFEGEYPSDSSVAMVIQLLRRNNLEKLKVSPNMLERLFGDADISSTCLGLKQFVSDTNKRFNFSELTENAKENFFKFLNQHMKFLEHLTVPCVIDREHIKLMLQMPKLKVLMVNIVLHNIDFTKLNLINTSIQTLKFIDFQSDINIVKFFIDCLPNLTHLHIHSLNQESLEYLSASAKKLTSLTVRTVEVTNFQGHHLLPELKEFSIDLLNSELEDEIKAIPEEEQTSLVKLLLQSSYEVLH